MNKAVKINKTSLAVILFSILLYLSGFLYMDPAKLGIIDSAGFPIVMQNMIAVCAGILLGGPQGSAAVGLYLMIGALGLPVFGSGPFSEIQGLARLTGQSGGFLLGYFFAAAASGFIMGKPLNEKPSVKKLIKASAAGYALIYIFGISQFLSLKGFTLSLQNIKAVFTVLILPYLPLDLVKLTATVLLGFFFRPLAARTFFSSSEKI
jgi:biotin transport system substrate-specific component